MKIQYSTSVYPDVFYALQVMGLTGLRSYSRWKKAARKKIGTKIPALAYSANIWPAIADGIHIEPTADFSQITDAIERVNTRTFQERVVTGIFHDPAVSQDLIEHKAALDGVTAALPAKKREWLSHCGLFPMTRKSVEFRALELLLQSPDDFHHDVVTVLKCFWRDWFESNWDALQPEYEACARRGRDLANVASLRECVRHSLLPIEIDERKQLAKALRGGGETQLSDVTHWIFTPSAFNARGLWSSVQTNAGIKVWAPYCDPDIRCEGLGIALGGSDGDVSSTDVALTLRALGDTTRFALVTALGKQPRTSVELAELLSVSKPTISHHIHILRMAGLLHETTHGKSTLISLNRAELASISEQLEKHLFANRSPLTLRTTRTAV